MVVVHMIPLLQSSHDLFTSKLNSYFCLVFIFSFPLLVSLFSFTTKANEKICYYPSFVKELTHSHVTKGFWLGLPKEFCLQYLPNHIAPVYLVDGNDEKSETKYLSDKNGLSVGWRGFAIHHGLLDGDALVFQQIHPTTFKVYIIRAYDQANNDSRRIGKENHDEINKKQEENVAEASNKLRGSRKRKRGGR